MNRIAELRKEKGWSQEDLAQELHIHQTSVSQWEQERTNPSFDMLASLCWLFDVSIDYIMGRSQERGSSRYTNAQIDELGIMEAETLLRAEQEYLLQKYSSLNETGKGEARKRIDELTRLEEYIKPEE